MWIALAACSGPRQPRDQGTVMATPTASSSETAAPEAALPTPTATAVDWPVVPAPSTSLEACPGPDVPFGEKCPRPPVDCTIGDAKRVHCECAGSEWRCLSGAAACFEGVRADAACSAAGASCELGNGLVFRPCACRDDRWACTGYGL